MIGTYVSYGQNPAYRLTVFLFLLSTHRAMVGKKSEKLKKTVGFVKDDIWRITDEEVSKSRSIWYKVIKIVSISTQRYVKDRMVNKASALTYSTLLSMVPILALLFAIARGFGFSNILETQ